MIKYRYPELSDPKWWEENQEYSDASLARRIGAATGTVYIWRHKMNIAAYGKAGPILGKKAEGFVMGRIRYLGGEPIKQHNRAPYDIGLGDIKIDVKSAAPHKDSSSDKPPDYRFSLNKGSGDCDFFVFVAKHPNDWACFVVPSNEVSKTYIRFRWPCHHPGLNPWARWLERWDLLGLL